MDETDFIFQLGNLKRTKRSGWLTIGISDCESVADHSYRTALISYIISIGEGLGERKARDAAVLALLHDVHESRVGDLHRLAKKYMKLDEKKAIGESLGPLKKLWSRDPGLLAIVKDADLLEMFFQAKEYSDEGNPYAREWLAPQKLKTKTAKAIYRKMAKRDSRGWLLGAVKW